MRVRTLNESSEGEADFSSFPAKFGRGWKQYSVNKSAVSYESEMRGNTGIAVNVGLFRKNLATLAVFIQGDRRSSLSYEICSYESKSMAELLLSDPEAFVDKLEVFLYEVTSTLYPLVDAVLNALELSPVAAAIFASKTGTFNGKINVAEDDLLSSAKRLWK